MSVGPLCAIYLDCLNPRRVTRDDPHVAPADAKVLCQHRDDALIGRAIHGSLAHVDHEDAIRAVFDKRTLTTARLGLHPMPAHDPTLASAAVTVWKILDVSGVRVRPFPYFVKVTDDIAVEAEGLVKSFKQTKALQGVSFQVPRGKVLGVLGPNGAGKTTAVRILATLLRADAGRAIVAGYDVARQPAEVRKRVGLTGQYASIDEELTGRENLRMIGELLNMRVSIASARAKELLEWFDLTDAADRMAKTYSGGMRRRLDLAASLTGHPEIVFLDEPTTGLDPAKREDMWDVVRDIVSTGTSVLLTTQYLEEADALADDIVVINYGEVIAHNTAENLKRITGTQTLRVRPADPSREAQVRDILVSIGTPGTSVDTPRPGDLSVPVTDHRALARAVAALEAKDIEVTEMSLMLPSLDEVFFTLTGERRKPQVSTDVTEEVSS